MKYKVSYQVCRYAMAEAEITASSIEEARRIGDTLPDGSFTVVEESGWEVVDYNDELNVEEVK